MGLAEAGPSGRAPASNGRSSGRGGGGGSRSGAAVNPFLYPQVGRRPFWLLSFCDCADSLLLKTCSAILVRPRICTFGSRLPAFRLDGTGNFLSIRHMKHSNPTLRVWLRLPCLRRHFSAACWTSNDGCSDKISSARCPQGAYAPPAGAEPTEEDLRLHTRECAEVAVWQLCPVSLHDMLRLTQAGPATAATANVLVGAHSSCSLFCLQSMRDQGRALPSPKHFDSCRTHWRRCVCRRHRRRRPSA